MRRREFIALAGGAAASWPLSVRAPANKPMVPGDDAHPRIETVIGLEKEQLMLFLSRLDGRHMTVALTDLRRADLEWLVWHFNRRQALLLLDEVDVLLDVDPDELADARRRVAGLVREVLSAGQRVPVCDA